MFSGCAWRRYQGGGRVSTSVRDVRPWRSKPKSSSWTSSASAAVSATADVAGQSRAPATSWRMAQAPACGMRSWRRSRPASRSRGIATLRYQFPYMENKQGRPDQSGGRARHDAGGGRGGSAALSRLDARSPAENPSAGA